MTLKKLQVILFDKHKQRYSITFNGKVTRKQVLRLLDLCELLGGIPSLQKYDVETKYDRIFELIKKEIPFTWFNSKKIKELYEQTFNESIKLSTVSTYLSRMTKEGSLLKDNRNFRLIGEITQELRRKDTLTPYFEGP